MFGEHKCQKDQYVVLGGCIDSYRQILYKFDHSWGICTTCYLRFDKGFYNSIYLWHEDQITPTMVGTINKQLPVIINILADWPSNLIIKRLAKQRVPKNKEWNNQFHCEGDQWQFDGKYQTRK